MFNVWREIFWIKYPTYPQNKTQWYQIILLPEFNICLFPEGLPVSVYPIHPFVNAPHAFISSLFSLYVTFMLVYPALYI